jgi:nucleotide-binding universal stress UspA family protein
MGEIVVGLDVSPSSHAALAWAAHHARTTGAQLRAVHALLLPSAMFAAVDTISVPTSTVGMDKADEAYRNAVTAVWELVQPEPNWRLEFYNADPNSVLVAESTHADLLVIGTREHVGWGRILNGSISHYCLSHAHCPIVAVPPPPRAGANPSYALAAASVEPSA